MSEFDWNYFFLFYSPGTFSMMPALESLNLDDNQIRGPLTFLRQPALKALSNLNLDANRLTGIDPEDFLHLTNLKSLLVNRNELRTLQFLTHQIFRQVRTERNKRGNNSREVNYV